MTLFAFWVDDSRAHAKIDGASASHISIKRGGEDRRFGT